MPEPSEPVRKRGRPRKVVEAPTVEAPPEATDDQPVMEPLEVAERFLDSLGMVIHGMRYNGWEEWIADRCRPFRGLPPVPAFLKYRIVGLEPENAMEPHSRRAKVVLTLVPSGALPVREMSGTLTLIRESAAWAKDGTGQWRVMPASWQIEK